MTTLTTCEMHTTTFSKRVTTLTLRTFYKEYNHITVSTTCRKLTTPISYVTKQYKLEMKRKPSYFKVLSKQQSFIEARKTNPSDKVRLDMLVNETFHMLTLGKSFMNMIFMPERKVTSKKCKCNFYKSNAKYRMII